MTREQLKDWHSDVRAEVEEIDADLAGAYEELKEIQERIAGLKDWRADRIATLKYIKGHLSAPKNHPVTPIQEP